jgi:hypothetical protein
VLEVFEGEAPGEPMNEPDKHEHICPICGKKWSCRPYGVWIDRTTNCEDFWELCCTKICAERLDALSRALSKRLAG